jgi:hypothetical protein
MFLKVLISDGLISVNGACKGIARNTGPTLEQTGCNVATIRDFKQTRMLCAV